MNKKPILGIFAAFALLSGCGSNANTTNLEESTAQTAESSTTTPTDTTETEAQEPSVEEAQKPTASEKLALDYLNTYVNNSDVEEKKKFVTEHIHPDAQALFDTDKLAETESELKVRHPVVIESVDYTDEDGVQTDAVLLQGETRHRLYNEVVVLVADNKIKWATETPRGAEFAKIRSEFQTPVPAETTPPLTVLDELVNFMIVDIWNEGFAQFHYYTLNGKNAYGEPLDQEAVMNHLSTVMSKKQEYDVYIDTLDENYEDVKKSWAPLSQETDRLYAQLLKQLPKPKDPDTDFDTASFQQNRDDFQQIIDDKLAP
ncbi:hypothetical protein [Saccharibacillus sacchari]|uniref:Uncharacterized protein n=1 Tax=Saccharibacillus sacchari TaxID=456493 RepID=A0ACC6PI79_9BACL